MLLISPCVPEPPALRPPLPSVAPALSRPFSSRIARIRCTHETWQCPNRRATAAEGVAVGGVEHGPAPQLGGRSRLHIPLVFLIQHAVRKRRPGADREALAVQSRAVVIHIVQLRAGLVPAGYHSAHRQPHALVPVHDIGQQLGGGRHRYALLVFQLVQAAAHAQVALPERAVRRAARHGAQEVGIDLDDLPHRARSDVLAHGGTRIHRHDDAVLKHKRQRGGAVQEADRRRRHCLLQLRPLGSGGRRGVERMRRQSVCLVIVHREGAVQKVGRAHEGSVREVWWGRGESGNAERGIAVSVVERRLHRGGEGREGIGSRGKASEREWVGRRVASRWGEEGRCREQREGERERMDGEEGACASGRYGIRSHTKVE
eukprot:ctg_282.g109